MAFSDFFWKISNSHFLFQSPIFWKFLKVFQRLREKILETFHKILVSNDIESAMYAHQWILSWFSSRFPLCLANRIIDLLVRVKIMYDYLVRIYNREGNWNKKVREPGVCHENLRDRKGFAYIMTYHLNTHRWLADTFNKM